MNFVVDTHTHSIASGHAYSTLEEMTKAARDKGLKMLILTDHGSSMIGAPEIIYFRNLHTISRKINEIDVLAGVEANVIDYNGNIDIDLKTCKRLDFIIASFHNLCIKPDNVETHTKAAIKAISNPYIDVIGHPGNPEYQLNLEEFVLGCKKYNKPIEINNHSFTARKGSSGNCHEILKLCKNHGVKIVCGSDAHFSEDVGASDKINNMFKEIEFPEELLLCIDSNSMNDYLQSRADRIKKN